MKYSLRALTLVLIVAVLGLASSVPARADVTSVDLRQLTITSVQSCPTDVLFTGTVRGTPGEQFGWIGVWTIGGVVKSSPTLTPATIGPKGDAFISMRVPITATSSPGDSFQFNTQTLVNPTNFNSAPIPIQIACSVPKGGDILLNPALQNMVQSVAVDFAFANDVPTNVRTLDTPSDPLCDAACVSMFHAGGTTIAFDYNDPQHVDGYRLYGHGLATPMVSKTLSFNVPRSVTGFLGPCYYVTAFRGSQESNSSKSVCLRRESAVQQH